MRIGMERETGTLVRWNNEKGYGFIRPHNGKEDIFLHVKSLSHSQRRPKEGDVLTYGVDVDDRQRYYACDAKIKGFAWSLFTLCWFCLTLLFCAYLYFVFQQKLPFYPLPVMYAGMSLVTIWAYGRDKRAARAGAWRTREFRLHLLEFLGGWPGAFLAQIFYRHKSRKVSYLIVFWLIVAAHGFLWYHIWANPDIYRPYEQAVTEKVDSLITQLRGGIRQFIEKDDAGPVSITEEQTEEGKEDPTSGTRSEVSRQRSEEPSQTTEAAKTDRRSLVRHDRLARIVDGVVKDVRPGEGVIVTLQSETGAVGIIEASTLVKDFAERFRPGERIQVAIGMIQIEGKEKRIELVLVEK